MILRTAAATIGVVLTGCVATRRNARVKTKKVLFFSKSSGYEHSVIKRHGAELSFAEKILADLGPKQGIDFTFSKDGSLFTPEYLAQFDAYFFYTSGDLTVAGQDKNPPMTAGGKAALLDAVRQGKGFIGTHAATDTFLTGGNKYENHGKSTDPYLRMLGAEFIAHNEQQKAKQRVADKTFPGMPGEDFELMEEWYSLKDFQPDLHALLVQETEGMVGPSYQRPPYPSTWARMHGKGRVFYTAMGHREDVWTNPMFQQLLFGGISWAVRNVDADVTPNLHQVTPECLRLPSPPTH